ncbi:hypothetical protein BESB_047170 [Besnoitia besnoiti]|uniref:K Homology domain-containing protein n=1 Tax=Besnoitia besnoiti TaxID=94643 RepID=A0A2A9MEV7_BESBE|nr:hypothetical protein BESB_047170 [Besnoitia besnoiti]PFH36525.1 hypothetical protein BESB_047170 [Besnoitia besnoiti]
MEEPSRVCAPRIPSRAEGNVNGEARKDRIFADQGEQLPADFFGGDSGLDQQAVAGARLASAPSSAPCYLKMLISNQLAGMIIGNTGQEIKHLKQVTGAKIVLSPHGMYFPGTTERLVAAEGTERAVFQVVDWIIDRLHDISLTPTSQSSTCAELLRPNASRAGGPAALQPRTLACKICVPRAVIGSLIGKNGGYIQSVRLATEANINISPLFVTADEACAERIVTVESHRKQSLRTAVFTLARKINTHPEKATCKHVCYYRKLNFESPHLPAANERENRQAGSRGRNQQNLFPSRNAYLDQSSANSAANSNDETDFFGSSFGANPHGPRSSLSKIGGMAPRHDDFSAFEAFSLAHARHTSGQQQQSSPSLASLVSRVASVAGGESFAHSQSQPSVDSSTAVDSGSDGVMSPARSDHMGQMAPGLFDPRAEFFAQQAGVMQNSQNTTTTTVVVRRSAMNASLRGMAAADAVTGQRLLKQVAGEKGGSGGSPDAGEDTGGLDLAHDAPSTVCSTAAGSMARLASMLQSIQEECEQQEWKNMSSSVSDGQRKVSGYSRSGSGSDVVRGSTLDASAPEFFPLASRTEELLGDGRRFIANAAVPTLAACSTAPASVVVSGSSQKSHATEVATADRPQLIVAHTTSASKEEKSAAVSGVVSAPTAGALAGAVARTRFSGLAECLDDSFMAFMKIWTLALIFGALIAIAAKCFFVEW